MPRYFATAAKGIELITAEELSQLGATNIAPSIGGVSFEGDLELLYKANLHLRTANRVLMPLREFAAATPEMLYDQVRRIKWEKLLNPDLTFAVDCTLSPGDSRKESLLPSKKGSQKDGSLHHYSKNKKGITHSHYAALKIKDAIVDQLRLKQGARPNVDKENPDVQIHAYFAHGRCILSLDASGSSLHERGYRLHQAEAPLKETLAAAIVELTHWNTETPFLDPMCGSGTLVLEAALKALQIAPGLSRSKFGFFGWLDFDAKLWKKVRDQAEAQILNKPKAPIIGFDQNLKAIDAALKNAKKAGLSHAVRFERKSIDQLQPIGTAPGVIVINPPYGHRIGEIEELKGLYKLLGDLFKQRMKAWTGFIFTGNLELAKHAGLRTSKRHTLYNGPIECRLLKYELY